MAISELVAATALNLASLLGTGAPNPACAPASVCTLEISSPVEPLAGQWATELSDIRKSGFCLSQVSVILEPMIQQMKVASPLSWPHGFHPDDLRLDHNARKIVWHEESVVSYVSERQFTRSSIVDAQYMVRLLDVATISLVVDFIVQDSPPDLGMRDCVVTAQFLVRHLEEAELTSKP